MSYLFFHPLTYHERRTPIDHTQASLTASFNANDRIFWAWQFYARKIVGFARIIQR